MAVSFRNSKKTTSFNRTIIRPVGLYFCASFLALVTPASSARPSPNLEDRELETLSRRYEVDLSTKALRLNLKEIASFSLTALTCSSSIFVTLAPSIPLLILTGA